MTGVYYFRDSARLLAAIEQIMAADEQTKGEFYLTDAIQVMIDDGARIEAATMDLWLDCGRPDTLLETNRVLLSRMDSHVASPRYAGSVIIPPVVIAPSARIERAVVGPYASVGENVTITDAIVRDVILNHESEIANVMLMNSIVGAGTVVSGDFHSVNVGDSSEVNLGGANSTSATGAKSMRWLEIRVAADHEAVEAVSELFARYGYQGGVAIEEQYLQDRDGDNLRVDPIGPVMVATYIPETPGARGDDPHAGAGALAPLADALRRRADRPAARGGGLGERLEGALPRPSRRPLDRHPPAVARLRGRSRTIRSSRSTPAWPSAPASTPPRNSA